MTDKPNAAPQGSTRDDKGNDMKLGREQIGTPMTDEEERVVSTVKDVIGYTRASFSRLLESRLRDAEQRLAVLTEFYRAWCRAESNGGCYSCCQQHDGRCGINHRKNPSCDCGRAELNDLDGRIEVMLAALKGEVEGEEEEQQEIDMPFSGSMEYKK